MPLAPANGTILHYEIAGAGPPLCLIAGFRQSSAAWPRPFLDALARRNTVIMFDNRGTGRSPPAADGYGLDNQARDVTGLLDALGLARVHLLGFSMGGAIAQEVVTQHPERIDRLILFGTFCGGLWSSAAPWPVLRRLFVTEGLTPEQAAREAWPVTYSPAYLAANPDAVEQQMWRELEHPTPGCVARRQMEAIRRFNAYAALPRIRSPTLVATGAADVLVPPRNAATLAARIPGARLEMLNDLGHRAIWEAPEEMAGLIGDFLTQPHKQREHAI
jgi:pimeloyl-ACP methyl ester carboxylesterase